MIITAASGSATRCEYSVITQQQKPRVAELFYCSNADRRLRYHEARPAHSAGSTIGIMAMSWVVRASFSSASMA